MPGHADERASQKVKDRLGIQIVDWGGGNRYLVPATLNQAGQLIEELRRYLEYHDSVLRRLVELIEPIVEEHEAQSSGRRLNP
jgi:hypothetical protein